MVIGDVYWTCRLGRQRSGSDTGKYTSWGLGGREGGGREKQK